MLRCGILGDKSMPGPDEPRHRAWGQGAPGYESQGSGRRRLCGVSAEYGTLGPESRSAENHRWGWASSDTGRGRGGTQTWCGNGQRPRGQMNRRGLRAEELQVQAEAGQAQTYAEAGERRERLAPNFALLQTRRTSGRCSCADRGLPRQGGMHLLDPALQNAGALGSKGEGD